MIVFLAFGKFVMEVRSLLVKERVERTLGEVLNDKLLCNSPGLSEHEELLENDWFLDLGAHIPPV